MPSDDGSGGAEGEDTRPGADKSHASGVGSETLAEIVANLRSDPHRDPVEAETSVYWTKDRERATVFTAVAPMARRLLLHPQARINWIEVVKPKGDHHTRSLTLTELRAEFDGQDVFGVSVTLPIGCILIKRSAREQSTGTAVVTKSVLQNDPRKDGGGADD